MNWFYFSSPSTFYRLAGWMAPWFFVVAAVLGVAGVYVGLVEAPTDAQQGEVYRVIFVHVPAAWMSMFLYFVMACYGAVSLTFNTRLAAMMARAIAPTGAMFTFVALWTGAFWGRPAWGTYWVWDARLTSELVLLFLYRVHRARQRLRGPRRSSPLPPRARGGVNLPIIYFSVNGGIRCTGAVLVHGSTMHGDAPGNAAHDIRVLDVCDRRDPDRVRSMIPNAADALGGQRTNSICGCPMGVRRGHRGGDWVWPTPRALRGIEEERA